ncbi:MAG TPA: GTPase Era [Candidatus Polarisedimenticolaceae bacterium]|nr:GTPase Era [Candidatus Polarisedimenticolaceae bacterium]
MSFRAGRAALVGWTNVGKSTLLNRLVGEKIAAVAAVAQTTRHRIVGVLPVEGRGQIVFVDTPGFHRPRERMNRAMVESARATLAEVDVVLLVVDAAAGTLPGDREVAAAIREAKTPAIAVLNKVDLVKPKTGLLPFMKTIVDEWGLDEVVPVSAATGEGCDLLVTRILERLPESEPLFPDDMLTDQPERLLAAEWVREKLLRHTREELPHSVAVLVRRWVERADGLVEIEAVVFVERESQKGMVIGKGGSLLKKVGAEARADIEKLLERHVFLALTVEVRPDWRNDPRALGELGIV